MNLVSGAPLRRSSDVGRFAEATQLSGNEGRYRQEDEASSEERHRVRYCSRKREPPPNDGRRRGRCRVQMKPSVRASRGPHKTCLGAVCSNPSDGDPVIATIRNEPNTLIWRASKSPNAWRQKNGSQDTVNSLSPNQNKPYRQRPDRDSRDSIVWPSYTDAAQAHSSQSSFKQRQARLTL